jgi:hypothetical protein
VLYWYCRIMFHNICLKNHADSDSLGLGGVFLASTQHELCCCPGSTPRSKVCGGMRPIFSFGIWVRLAKLLNEAYSLSIDYSFDPHIDFLQVLYTPMYMFVCIYMCVCVCVCMYLYLSIYICIYIYIERERLQKKAPNQKWAPWIPEFTANDLSYQMTKKT